MENRERGELLAVVKRLSWTYAKTMPQCPHYWTKRTLELEAEYVQLFEATKKHGVVERWGRYERQYLDLGDGFKYWRMTDDLEESTILNRAEVGAKAE